MNRETKTFKTPGGHTIEHYAYLTGKESREIGKIFFSAAEIEADADQKNGKNTVKFNSDKIFDTQALAIKLLCVSFNGNKDGVADAIDNLPVEDYNAVVEGLNPILEPVFQKKDDFLAKSSTPATA
jgi:hypothetical protein